MATEENYDRCVRAGTAFEKVPEVFILLLSKREVTDVKLTGKAARYQVFLTRTSYLQPDRNPCTPYGLVQFINCCLPEKSTINWIGGQSMKTKQCEIVNHLYHELKPEYTDISPAYVRTATEIKQGDEFLLPSGYGGRHKKRA